MLRQLLLCSHPITTLRVFVFLTTLGSIPEALELYGPGLTKEPSTSTGCVTLGQLLALSEPVI